MQWMRAACVRPAPSMRVCAWSYLGRASVAKTVVDILQQLQILGIHDSRCKSCWPEVPAWSLIQFEKLRI